MTKLASELQLGDLSTYVYPTETYDATKLGLPNLMVQHTGATAIDKWVGPIPNAVARPLETSGAIPGTFPFVINYSPTEDWVFLADNAAVAATRRIQMFKFNRTTSTFAWKGFITLNFPFAGTQGTYTVRAFRMLYNTYTTGTTSVNGSAVTGSGTAWTDVRIPTGCRIGFGSTNPLNISTWYEISSINSNTSITLTTTAESVSNVPYVIEDLRAVVLLTNAVTTTNGGLFSVKGLNHDTFSTSGTSISAATNTDNIRAVYWHTDAATNTNIVGVGMGLPVSSSFTEQHLYVLDTLANPVCFKYDLKAALTPSSGKDTNAFLFKTGAGGALTGTLSQVNNCRLVSTNHGPGSGIECMYFTTTTRVYRTAPVSTFTAGSTSWLSGGDVMTEIPPGSTTTQSAFGTMNSIEYSTSLDRFIITTTSATGARHYLTQFKTDASPFDRVLFIDTKQLSQSTSSIDVPPIPTTLGLIPSIWVEGGIAFMVSLGTTALTNYLYAFPIAADWEYINTSNQRLILPKMSTVGATQFSRVSPNFLSVLGGKTGNNLGTATEGGRLLYRTSGIDDNTGAWTLVSDTGDLSGVNGADYIQFAAEFKTIGQTCLPSRLYNLIVTYDATVTDSHYQPSVKHSSINSKVFAWRFSTAWGGTVPTLTVKLYNAVTNFLLNEDDTVTQDGTWEKSTDDGATWNSYNTTDKINDTTYIRYIPSALIDDVKIRAILTV